MKFDAAGTDLSDSAWITLLALLSLEGRPSGYTIQMVASRAGFPRNTAVRGILQLEQSKLASVARDTRDRRAVSVSATAAGVELVSRCVAAAERGLVRLSTNK